MLALPTERFAAASVLDAGPDWMERFRTLCKRQEIKVLADSEALPAWLAAREGYTIWERNNRWILHTALSRSDIDITLIVLWDGAGGDGPGGTRDMVKLATSRGVRVVSWTPAPSYEQARGYSAPSSVRIARPIATRAAACSGRVMSRFSANVHDAGPRCTQPTHQPTRGVVVKT